VMRSLGTSAMNMSYQGTHSEPFDCLTTGVNTRCSTGPPCANGPPYDVVVFLLGTIDSVGAHWPQDACPLPSPGTARLSPEVADASFSSCPFVSDYLRIISMVRNLGTGPNGPLIYLTIPPPIMSPTGGANLRVINQALPELVPRIARAAGVRTIDAFGAFGGNDIPADGPVACQQVAPEYASATPCSYLCNQTWCDNMHPTDDGYRRIGETMFAALSDVLQDGRTRRAQAEQSDVATRQHAMQPQ